MVQNGFTKGHVMKPSLNYNGHHGDSESEYDVGPVDFERAVTLTGNGKFNHLLLLALIPICWSNTYTSAAMSYVLPSAECELKLTSFDKGLLNSMPFAGMIVTNFIWGFIVDGIGRQKVMVWGSLVIAVCTLASSFCTTPWQLVALKFVDGSVSSGPYAALQSYLAEVHAEKKRAQMYMWMGIMFALGHITLACLAWVIIPQNWSLLTNQLIQVSSWRIFLGLSSLPGLTACFVLCFFPESPRFLMAKRRNSEALDVFRKIYAMNTGKDPDTYPVKYLEGEETVEIKGVTFKQTLVGSIKQIQPIFLPPNVITLVITAFIQFGATIGSNTLRLWMPTMFSIINQYHIQHPYENARVCYQINVIHNLKNVTGTQDVISEPKCNVEESVYLNAIVISCTSVIGYMIAKLVVNRASKRILMIFCFVGAGASLVALYWAETSIEVLVISSIFVTLPSIAGTIINNVIVDVFPTSLRTMALSMTMAIGRAGAIVGNVLFPILLDLDCLGPFIMIGGVCFVCATLTLVLPRKKL